MEEKQADTGACGLNIVELKNKQTGKSNERQKVNFKNRVWIINVAKTESWARLGTGSRLGTGNNTHKHLNGDLHQEQN